jgi:hypothetical protein
VLFEKENRERRGSSTLPQPPNITMNLTVASLRSASAGYRRRSPDNGMVDMVIGSAHGKVSARAV